MISIGKRSRYRISAVVCIWAAAVCGSAAGIEGVARVTADEARMEMMRQLYEATSIYAFHVPVLVEETAIAVKLAPDADRIEWNPPTEGFEIITLPGRSEAVVALDIDNPDAVLAHLRKQGEATVLHRRRWTALNNHASFVHGGSPAVSRSVRTRTGEIKSAATAQGRDDSTKLTLNIRGLDTSGSKKTGTGTNVLDFDLTLDMTYMRKRDDSSGMGRPASLMVECRSKLHSGHTLLIEDIHGDQAVLFLLTLTLVGN